MRLFLMNYATGYGLVYFCQVGRHFCLPLSALAGKNACPTKSTAEFLTFCIPDERGFSRAEMMVPGVFGCFQTWGVHVAWNRCRMCEIRLGSNEIVAPTLFEK